MASSCEPSPVRVVDRSGIPEAGGAMVSSTSGLYDDGCDEGEVSGKVKLGCLVGIAGAGPRVTSLTMLVDAEGRDGRLIVSRAQRKFWELQESA